MASSKRKRKTTTPTSNKRPKHSPADDDPNEEHPLNDILAERTTFEGTTEYLIDWKPKDGRAFTPTWQPEENLNPGAVEWWEDKKAKLARAKEEAARARRKSGSALSRTRKNESAQLPLEPPSRPTRTARSRVVESSPSAAPTSSSTQAASGQSRTREYTARPPLRSPQIQVSQRAIDHSEYERFSQLPTSASSSFSRLAESFCSSQSSYTGSRNFLSSGIVYDSEGEDAEDEAASYVPTTQDAFASPPASSLELGLTIIERPTFSLPSENTGSESPLFPAISIPETEPEVSTEHDSVEDSHAELQRLSPPPSLSGSQTDQQREIADSLDIIVSTSQPAPQEVVEKAQSVTEEELGAALSEEEPPLSESVEQARLLNSSAEPAESAAQPQVEDFGAAVTEDEPLPAEQDNESEEQSQPVDGGPPVERENESVEQPPPIVEDEPPQIEQELETGEETTLLDSSAEPAHSAAQQVKDQVVVPAPLVPPASDESEGAHSLLEQDPQDNQEQPALATQREPGSGAARAAALEKAELPEDGAEQQPSEQHITEQPAGPPTTEVASGAEAHHAVAEETHTENLTYIGTTQNSFLPAPVIDAAERSSSASAAPVERSQHQPSPNLKVIEKGASAQPTRELDSITGQSASLGTVVQTSQALLGDIDSSTGRQDLANPSSNNSRVSAPQSSTQPTPFQQHAQRIPVDTCLSTQEKLAESICDTVEEESAEVQQASPQSRHDSSQESPEPFVSSVPISSPLLQPPSQSLGTLTSNASARPRTPAHSSQVSDMEQTSEEILAALKAKMKEHQEKMQKENPFIPTRKLKTSSRMLSNSGTRSPSTIPDRSPLPQVPTSLRTVAVSNSAAGAAEAGPSEPVFLQEEGESGTSDNNHNVADFALAAPASTDDEMSDASDASLLNDDLQLQAHEYVVPLPIEGRQASMYRDEIKNHQDIIKAFMTDPEGFEQIDKIETVIERLGAIETHIDLVFSASLPSQDTGSSTQLQHQTQWSFNNSIKFRFVGTLLHKLRDRDLHVVLVLENDDARLFDIVETFLKGRFINFNSPTRGRQADPALVEGDVKVTVLSKNSSPIVRPVDLIICLDGHAEAAEIRKKNWAANPDIAVVPLLHLVIPRTVDHIARYTSPALNSRRRLHTILASLAQLQSQGAIGRAMSHTLKTNEAANEIVHFLAPEGRRPPVQWPLPSIGSIKDVIEFQSQQSQDSISSPPRGTSVVKRALEDDTLDPAKRMRFTPQPGEPTSSTNNEITHISDSMPGTAVEVSKLQQELKRERLLRKDVEERFRQFQVDCSRQQTLHEDRGKANAELSKEMNKREEELAAAKAKVATLTEGLDAKNTEYRALQTEMKELKNSLLQSTDEKVAENMRLQKEVAECEAAAQRAQSSKESSDKMVEYVKEQYRIVGDLAKDHARDCDRLTEENEILKKQASGERRGLMQAHYECQQKLQSDQLEKSAIEKRILQKQVAALTEENARLKNGRGVGVGTRGQTPRPNSRAASPMPAGHRDRLANLRNG
ncbi:hypothetical protein K458DRAFT_403457 [Lentithecium fluviatile CBS 122367]|uniref:Chromo domain-containing protein n=1 Tax=Lentithecium fluviatile CBS 122367 TaxID=1168545 RepID=A0A6G1J3Z3_9PLEO|nr:hypothetical protein K458DRAFT_403457 [Lentithecium fluviatile CBS 122367]